MAQFTSFGASNNSGAGWLFINPASGEPGAYNLAASDTGVAVFDYGDGTRTVLHGTGFSKTAFALNWTTLTSAEHTDTSGAVTYETITGIGAGAGSANFNGIYNAVMTGANTFNGSANADYMAATLDPTNGGAVAQPDTFFGGGGADILYGGGGDDIFRYTSGTDVVVGESVSGASGTDTIWLENAGDIFFRIGSSDINLSSIEILQFLSGNSTATFGTVQLLLGSGPKTFVGSAGIDGLVLEASGDDLSTLTFNNWTPGQDTITITHPNSLNGTVTGTSQNDTFRFPSLSHGLFQGALGDDTFVLPAITSGAITIDGGDGLDTVVYTAKTTAVVVTLNGATDAVVTVNGVATETIRNVENVAGGSAADNLTGDGLANVLTGDAGNDTLDGAGGLDTAVFSGNRAQYAVAYNAGTQTLTLTDLRGGAPDGIDTIKNIESFRFADGTVTFAGLNSAPTAVGLTNTTASLPESASTATHIKVADIAVTDDGLGTNTLGLTGADAAFFEIVGAELFLKAGTVLDSDTKASYSVAVTVDDASVGGSPDATSATYTLNISGNAAPTAVSLTNTTASLAENTSTATRIKVADIGVTDDGLGTNVLGLTGADAIFFEVDGSALFLKAGTALNFENKTSYSVAVTVDDTSVGTTPDATSATYTLGVTNIVEGPEITVTGNGFNIADNDLTPGAADGTAFGTVGVGSVVTRTFSVTNDGDAALLISKFKMPKGFVLTEGLSASIAPGATDTFTVRMDTAKVGAKTGQITFTTNDANETPFNFALGGNVIVIPPEIEVRGNGIVIADNDLLPGSADGTAFGNVPVGSTVIHTFTVNNTGAGVLSISKLKMPKGFVLVEGLSATIAPGQSDTFQVRVDTAKIGAKTGSITFTTNDPDETPFNFAFSANVTAAPLTASVMAASVLGQGGGGSNREPNPTVDPAPSHPGVDDPGHGTHALHHFDLM